MACIQPQPIFASPTDQGIDVIKSQGDGKTILLQYSEAYSTSSGLKVAYNLYFSSLKDDVFKEGPKYVTEQIEANISQFVPYDKMYFAVRAMLWSFYDMDIKALPPATDVAPDCYVYPESPLLSSISSSDTIISLLDVTDFPNYGVVVIGSEAIVYYNVDRAANTLNTTPTGRGQYGSTAVSHNIDGYDVLVKFFHGYEEKNDVIISTGADFYSPNYAYTENDGYKQVTTDILNTNLSASDASNIILPEYDYTGYHQTSMLDVFGGHCIGSYQGGEYGCADGYGGKSRGLNIQEANIQRQEMLLSVTGEPVVLLRRRWTGIRCSCFRAHGEAPEARCHVCFTPDSLVRTINGYEPIESIKIGDFVLSSDGEFHVVNKVMISPFDGYMSSILSATSTNPILATPEHPFLSVVGDHKIAIGCGPKCNKYIEQGDGNCRSADIRQIKSGRWHARVQIDGTRGCGRKVLGTFDTREEALQVINDYKNKNIKPGHIIDWVDAKDLNDKSWLVYKTPNINKINDVNEICIPDEFLKQTKLGSLRNGVDKFVVDEDFMWILGIYIAEGSSSKRHINFALHKKEIEFQQKIINYFEKFGYSTALRELSENGISIDVYSTTLACWFPKLLGHLCYNKKIPESLMFLPNNKTKALLKGIYDGDGCKSVNEITQTSEILALQISELLYRIGENPLIHRQISNILTLNGNKRRVAYCVSWAEETIDRENRKGHWNFEKELLSKVRNVDEKYYCGNVYNLEVEGNHTYVVNSVVVHNCFGVGYVGGYDQYYNPKRSDRRLLIRFDATADDVAYKNKGFEQNYLPNCWSVVVPAIKDRDIIIRFDETGADEYRYEVLNVNRNKLLFSLSGAQKFQLHRMDKTDMIYQWRALRDASKLPSRLLTNVSMLAGHGPHAHEIIINEKTLSISDINQTTSVSAGHQHVIINGILKTVLGHSHDIVIL